MECRAILEYSNVVGNISNRLDVTYERACMATQEDEYHTDLLETIISHNDRQNVPLSNEKL